MPTVSGTIGQLLTARDVITRALRVIGVLDAYTPPTAEMASAGLQALTFMLKGWQADGCNIFRRAQESLAVNAPVTGVATSANASAVLTAVDATLLAGVQVGMTLSSGLGFAAWTGADGAAVISSFDTVAHTITMSAPATSSHVGASYTFLMQAIPLSPNVLDVPEARWLQSPAPTPFERPLAPYQYSQFMSLPNKAAQSSAGPTLFMFDKATYASRLWLWPIPAAASSLNFSIARIIDDVGALGDNLDLPQEWTEAAYYCLADRMMDEYGAIVDPNLAQRIAARAAMLYQKVLDFDRPTSVFFKPWGRPGVRYGTGTRR